MSSITSSSCSVSVTLAKGKGITVETFEDLRKMVEHYTLDSCAPSKDYGEHVIWLKKLRPAITKAIMKFKAADDTVEKGLSYEEWFEQLEKVAVEKYGFSNPPKLDVEAWRSYFDEDLSPEQAIEEDLSYA